MLYLCLQRGDFRSLKCALAAYFVPHAVCVVECEEAGAGAILDDDESCGASSSGSITNSTAAPWLRRPSAAQSLRATGHPGWVRGSDAVLRTLGRLSFDTGGERPQGMGMDPFVEAQVDSWLALVQRLDVILLSLVGIDEAQRKSGAGKTTQVRVFGGDDAASNGEQAAESVGDRSLASTASASSLRRRAMADLESFLLFCDAHLRDHTFVAGERLSVADLALFASVAQALVGPTFEKSLDAGAQVMGTSTILGKNCKRWFRTVQTFAKIAWVRTHKGSANHVREVSPTFRNSCRGSASSEMWLSRALKAVVAPAK